MAVPTGLFLLIVLCYPFLFTRFSSGVPYARANDLLYILSIVQYLIHAPIVLAYHLPFFYPAAFVTTYGHPLFGIALIFKLFQIMGLSLTQSINLYIIVALLAGALGCFMLVREVNGDRFWAFAVAAFYIFAPHNYLHFAWLNFLSSFWIPWVLYFFLKYFRSGRWGYLAGAAFCVFYQFFTEIYYGFHLIVFLLPLFIAAALWQKMLSRRRLIAVLASLFLVGLLIIAVFSPFIWSAERQEFQRSFSPNSLINPRQLFLSDRLAGIFLEGRVRIGQSMTPGLALTFLTLAVFAGSGRNRTWALGGLGAMQLALVVLATRGGALFEALFVVLLASLAFLAWRNWGQFSAPERLFVSVSSVFFVLLLGFENLRFLNSLAPYRLIYEHFPGMAGMRSIKRIYPLLFPFWMMLAAVAGRRLERTTPALRRVPRGIVPLCVCAIIFLENARLEWKGISGPLPEKEAVYEALPFEKNKVVLDWPCAYGRENPGFTRHQMFSWGYHHNFLVNGKTAFLPAFVQRFRGQIGAVSKSFPTEEKLRRLIEHNSVDYIVFHFHPLGRSRAHYDLREVRRRISLIRNYGEVAYSDPDHVLMRLREMRPLQRAVRTYALYHLRRCGVRVRLEDPCRGTVRIVLNGRPGLEVEGQGRKDLIIDLRHERLEVEGNRLEIVFPEPVRLAEIALIPGASVPHEWIAGAGRVGEGRPHSSDSTRSPKAASSDGSYVRSGRRL
jgi:hypothetical protein